MNRLTLKPHEIRCEWSKRRKRWVCQHCRRKIRFHGSRPFHKRWWV